MKRIQAIVLCICVILLTMSVYASNSESWTNKVSINLSTSTINGDGAEFIDGNCNITKEGQYTFTGETPDGMIYINTTGSVSLVLDGVTINNSDGPAIFFENSKKGYITVADGSENYLSDSTNYSYEAKGTIFSNDDLIFDGNGTLDITSNYKNGIASDDDIQIDSGNIVINTVNDGIKAKDKLTVNNGTINIISVGDGITAEDKLEIVDGSINITTTGDITENEETVTEESKSAKGIKAENDITIDGGNISLTTTDHAIHSAGTIVFNDGDIAISSEEKGISGHGNVTINNGNINIKKSTEGIESKAELVINDGNIDIISSDDGINAGGGNSFGRGMNGGFNKNDFMNNSINPSQNGMQQPPTNQNMQTPNEEIQPPENNRFNGENIEQFANRGQRPDMQNPDDLTQKTDTATDESTEDVTHSITINGGNIYVNANGDGIDSNGDMTITGGLIQIDGPTNSGNGSLDHNGVFNMDGGTLIAVGSSGMIEAPDSSSKQNTLVYCFDSTYNAGSNISVTDSKGNEIAQYTSAKEIQSVIISSSKLEIGVTYTVNVDGTKVGTATLSEVVTKVGNSIRSFGGMNGDFNRGNKINNRVNLKVNGVNISTTEPAVLENDTTLVPIRAVLEALGATVNWEEDTQAVTISKDNTVMELKIGNTDAKVNSNSVLISQSPILKNNTTMVPIRFIAENFGFMVDWDENTQTVNIN